ncbi:MAG: replication initiator protein [Arizlama microvirus]|nr:MAG: replication initiator protein [Arizlama microvirus]
MPRCTEPVNLTDKKTGTVYTVPCGTCPSCKINRTTDWTTRIIHESMTYDNNLFITLTYDDIHIPDGDTLDKRQLQLFLKRLRKNINKDIRYFACGEYGELYNRPHYHMILFNASLKDRICIENSWTDTDSPITKRLCNDGQVRYTRDPLGMVHIGTMTEASARYTAKYLQKKQHGINSHLYSDLQIDPEFMLSSRRPAIGLTYAKKFLDNWIEIGYITVNGIKRPIPRAYIKAMTDEQLLQFKIWNEFRREKNNGSLEYYNTREDSEEQTELYIEEHEKEVSTRNQRNLNIQAKSNMKRKKPKI